MRNLKVIMSYNGAAYHGFQRQENGIAVQEVVENTIGKLLKIPPPVIYGCSRTDSGVHAKSFCFNFRTDNKIPCGGFIKGMNTLLPPDIAVLSCEEADEDFHARFSCRGKKYVYLISNTPQRDVFLEKLAFHYPYSLDLEKMNAAARLLVGEHDFAAFCRAEGKLRQKSTVREIYGFSAEKKGELCEISISGSGFLYNMVRICVGTLIYINEGKLGLSDIKTALETGNRLYAGKTLPACGLYLSEVWY